MDDKRKVLYESLSGDGYDLGDFSSFSEKMNNPEKRKALYDAVGADYDLGDYDTFESKLGYKEATDAALGAKNEVAPVAEQTVQSPVELHVAEQPVAEQPASLSEEELDGLYTGGNRETMLKQAKEAKERASKSLGDALNKDFDEQIRFQREHPILSALAGTRKSVDSPLTRNKDVRDLTATVDKAEKAIDLIGEANKKGSTNFFAGFGRGFWNTVTDPNTFSMGSVDMALNHSLMQAAKKYEAGEQLSDNEQLLMDTYALNAAVQQDARPDLGRGYKAGMVTGEMAPFMAEMALNPASGLGKGIMKQAVKKFGKEGMSALARNSIKISSRVAGDIVGASIMAGTTGSMQVGAGAMDRHTGGAIPTFTDEGYVRFDGTEQGDDVMTSLAKEYGSQTIERWSEMVGEGFNFAGKLAGAGAAKALNKMGLSKVNDMITSIKASDVAKVVDDFASKTQWNGVFGEFMEEQVGLVANSLTVGDSKLSDLWNWDQQLDTFLGVSVFGGFMSGVKSFGYRAPGYDARKRVSRANKAASKVFGEKWDNLSIILDEAEGAEDYAKALSTLRGDELRAALGYVSALEAGKGASIAELKRKTEGDIPDERLEIEGSFDAGYQEEAPEAIQSAYAIEREALNKRRETLGELLEEELGDIINANPLSAVGEIMQHKELTDDEKEECIDAILAHANAQAKIKGIKAKFADNLEGKIEQAYDYIDGIKHEDGNVYDFTMKENDDKHVNLIKGNVTIGEDGIIDTQKSDPFVFVKDASGVRMLSPHELFKRSSVQSSQELKQITGQTIMEQEYGVMEALESTPSEQEVNNTVASYEPGQEITLYPNGQPINATVQTAVNEEGRIQLMFDSPIEMNGQQVQVAEFSSEELGNLLNPQEVIDSNLPENNTQSEVAPPVEDGTMTEEQLQEVWKQKQAEIEQGNTKAEVISTPSFPTDKSGNIDYAQIEDNQMYADALESEFGEEAASIIDDELAVQEKKLKAAENKGTAIERARAKKAITQEIERLNGIKGLIPSYIAKQQKENEALQTEAAAKQEEEHNVMGNASHNEQLRYIAENSEDVNQILAAFEEAKELSEVSTLEPWEDALLTYQVKQASFEQFGDKNNITGTLARAWFSKNAKSVDQVAAELSAVTGKTITDQDVVDFITSHPSRNARKTSDEQRLLSRRFSEVASKITGTPVGGPESATGRVFVKMQQGMQTQAAVSSAIVDNASEQIEGVATSETFDADLYAMYEAESFEPSDAEVEQYLNILNNEQRNVQNEVSTGEASQGEPVMQDARETAGSQEEGGSGTSNRGSEKATTEVGIFAAAQTAIDNHNASKPVRSAEKEVDTNPTEAQKEAGNYKMGHTTLDGRNVTIENPKGSVRSGVDADGKAWSQEMKNTYGYFRRTEGNDGDHVDVFIGDKLASGKVFVVDQIDKDGLFDEHKVMYGFDSKEDAEAAYLSNYEEGWQGLGAITEFEKESFFDWLDNEDKSKPVSYEETLTPKMIYGEYMDMAKEEGEEPISYDEFMEELSKPESSKEVYNFFVDKYGKDFSDAISLDNFTSMFAKKEDVEMIELTPENIHKAISDYAEKNEFDSFPYDEFIGLMSNAESRKDAYDVLSEIFGDKFTKNFTLDDLADLFAKNESETVATEEIAKGDVENKEDFLTPTGIYNAYAKIQSDKGIIPLSYNEFISKMSNKEAATRLHVILGSNLGDEFSKAVTAKEFVDVLVKNKKEMLADNKEEIREEDKTEGVNSNEPAPSESSNEEVAPTEIEAEEKKDPLLESKYLGKLKKGEFCHVERVFSESKAFSFTGKDKVETIDDVAFIFRQLENSSIENSFAVLVKDGEATVLHLGMGSFDQTVANTDAIYAAFNRIPCDDIYFVHNHPSGNLVSSGADRQMYRKLKGIYGDKMKPAIIINITSGKYGLFDSTDESFGKIPESDNTDMPLRTYTFDKYVFEEGFNPEDKPTVTSIKDVASFVSSHRLGKRNKLSALILSQSGRIVGNVFLPYANVTAKNRSKIVSYLKERVVNLGGASAILYGRAGNLDDSLRKEARKNDLQILDVVDVENYLEKSNSLSEEGALKIEDETKALKLKEKEVLTTPYMADSKKEISEAAEELAKELGEEIEIIARDEMPEGHKRAQGYYNPRTGKITVCPENHNSVEDVRRTIFHEAVAHKGLSGLFGESFDDFLKDTYKNASSDVRDRINRMASRNGWDIKLATEEYLAMQAERGFDDSLMSMVRELFNGMISKAKKALGFKLNDSDIRYVLWKSYRNMKGKGGSIIDIAEDIAIKNKLFDKTSERVFNAKFGSEEVKFRERTDPAPTKTGIGYKVFVLKQGKLYPPMVANPGGADTPVGVWLDADAAPVAGESKTGRMQVKAGGKGTQGGSGKLAYRPGWHLGQIPYAIQFNRLNQETGEKELFPANFVWAEVEYADDVDYNEEAYQHGVNSNGKYQHSLAGLPRLPKDGSYMYRTNPNPETDPWVITGAMKVTRILKPSEVDQMVIEAGREPQRRQEGAVTDEDIEALRNDGLRFRDTTVKDVLNPYDVRVKQTKNKLREAYQDSMLSLKILQEEIAKETSEIKDFENAYMAENQMSSRSAYETEFYKDNFYIPMVDAVDALMSKGKEYENIKNYVIAKHGLERNKQFAWRDALETLREDKDTFEAVREEELSKRESLKSKRDNGIITNEEFESELFDLRSALIPAYIQYRGSDYSGLTVFAEGEENFEEIAQEMVDSFEKDFEREVGNLWNKINAATKESLKKSFESGVMSKQQYQHVNSMFEHYVPLRAFDETIAADVYEYMLSERSIFSPPVKAARGRKSLADDPFAVIGNMAESGIMQGNRNMMKQRFLNMAMNHNTHFATVRKMWYINVGTTENPVWEQSIPDIEGESTEGAADILEQHEIYMKQMEKEGRATQKTQGLNIRYKSNKKEKEEHSVQVKVAGKEFIVFVNGNPRAAQAVNGLTNPDASDHNIIKYMGKVNRFLAANFTTRNPAFVLSNASRDIIFSSNAVFIKEGFKYFANFEKNLALNVKDIAGMMTRYRNGGLEKNGKDALFLEFLENGGETGYTALNGIDEYKKMMKRYLNKSTGKTGKAKNMGLAFVESVQFMNRCAEDISRFTTYQTSREMGRSVQRSISDAKEVTVNFNKKGAGGYGSGTFKSLYLFFNAAVQSLDNFSKLAKRSPIKFTSVLGSFIAAGMLSGAMNEFMIGLLGGDDDEYDNLPEWVRKNNFCIYTGGGFITIPLPIELRAFYGIGDIFSQWSKGNMKYKNVGMELANQMTELLPLNPLGSNTQVPTSVNDALAAFAPDAVKPIFQIAANKDYTGIPIYKKSDFNKHDPNYRKGYKSTNRGLVGGAELLNHITGGDKYVKGWANVNPAAVEHLMESYFGGVGTTINQLAKTVTMIWNNDARVFRNVPVANRFFNVSDDKTELRKVNEAYYLYKNQDEEYQYIKNGYTKDMNKGIMDYAEKVNKVYKTNGEEKHLIFKAYNEVIEDASKTANEMEGKEREQIDRMIGALKAEMIREIEKVDQREKKK